MKDVAKDFSSSNLRKKFSHGLILNLLIKFKGLIFVPTLVFFISQDDIGRLSQLRTLAAMMTGIVLLNIPDSANRIVLESKEESNGTINSINNFTFLWSIFAILSFFFLNKIFNYLRFEDSVICCLFIFTSSLDKISKYIYQIYQETSLLLKSTLSIEYISFLICLLIFIFTDYQSYYVVLTSFMMIQLLTSIFVLNKLYKRVRFIAKIDFKPVVKVLKVSIFLLPSFYGSILLQSSDILIIEKFLGVADLGVYSVAISLATPVTSVSAALAFFWYSTAVSSSSELQKQIISKVSFWLIPFTLLVFVAYTFLIWITEGRITSPYLQSLYWSLPLALGQVSFICVQLFQGILYAKGLEKVILFNVTLALFLNVSANIIFVPLFGAFSAAISTLVSYVVLLTLHFSRVRKYSIIFDKRISLNFIVLILILSILLWTLL